MNSMNKTNDNKYCDKCYVIMSDAGVCCPDRSCRYFLHSTEDLNCAIVAAQSGPKTLQEIGGYYGISRMRICQIEKSILAKLRKSKAGFDEFND